jgi:hypothetical protein
MATYSFGYRFSQSVTLKCRIVDLQGISWRIYRCMVDLSAYRIYRYEGVSKSFRTGRLDRELQMIELSATRCSCIAILWVSLVSYAAITFCIAFNERLLLLLLLFDLHNKFRNIWFICLHTEFIDIWLICLHAEFIDIWLICLHSEFIAWTNNLTRYINIALCVLFFIAHKKTLHKVAYASKT